MRTTVQPSPVEHAVDLMAASIPAIAASWSAAVLAPLWGVGAGLAMTTAGTVTFVAALLSMRASGRRELAFAVPAIDVADASSTRLRVFSPPAFDEALDPDRPLSDDLPDNGGALRGLSDVPIRFATPASMDDDDVLLLDEEFPDGAVLGPLDQHAVERRVEMLSELILDDPLAALSPESRVVRLFAPQPLPQAGVLADDIARHIGARDAVARMPAPDASDALNDALDSLRNTLRRA
jgi:hypothetical protein